MNDVIELIDEVRKTGASLRVDPPDLIIKPADCVPADLKARLREHKSEIVRLLELEASMHRLEEARVFVSVSDDGSMRILIAEAVPDNTPGSLFSPRDMYHYIQLQPHERRMLHEFKRGFGGSMEWRPAR